MLKWIGFPRCVKKHFFLLFRWHCLFHPNTHQMTSRAHERLNFSNIFHRICRSTPVTCQLVQLGLVDLFLQNVNLDYQNTDHPSLKPLTFGLSTCATWGIPCQLLSLALQVDKAQLRLPKNGLSETC